MKKRELIYLVLLFAAPPSTPAQNNSPAAQAISLPPDSPRWKFEGEAKPVEYLGRKSIYERRVVSWEEVDV